MPHEILPRRDRPAGVYAMVDKISCSDITGDPRRMRCSVGNSIYQICVGGKKKFTILFLTFAAVCRIIVNAVNN